MRVQASKAEGMQWLVDRAGHHPTAGFKCIEAVDASGRIRGVIGFDNWTANACQVHFAVATPIAFRHLIPEGFDYVFNQGKRGVITGVIAANNKRSLRMAHRLGLTELCRIRDGHAVGIDLVVLELRKENCRYLNGQRRAA